MASSAAEYGSADHHQAFADSLAGTASDERVKGRLAAARSHGTHPSTAPAPSKAPAKARKTNGRYTRCTENQERTQPLRLLPGAAAAVSGRS